MITSFIDLSVCDWSEESGRLKFTFAIGKRLDADTIEDCKSLCIDESTFICAAVNYEKEGTACELLLVDDSVVSSERIEGWQYAIRPICAGKHSENLFLYGRIIFELKL